MATEIGFNQGKDLILTSGMPATSSFMLASDPIAANPASPGAGELYAGSTPADVHEVSWTGFTPYARKTQSTPAPADGIINYTLALDWKTSEAVDGPADARTLILFYDSSPDKLIYAWDVPTIVGKTAALNISYAELNLNPGLSFFFFLQNVGGN